MSETDTEIEAFRGFVEALATTVRLRIVGPIYRRFRAKNGPFKMYRKLRIAKFPASKDFLQEWDRYGFIDTELASIYSPGAVFDKIEGGFCHVCVDLLIIWDNITAVRDFEMFAGEKFPNNISKQEYVCDPTAYVQKYHGKISPISSPMGSPMGSPMETPVEV